MASPWPPQVTPRILFNLQLLLLIVASHSSRYLTLNQPDNPHHSYIEEYQDSPSPEDLQQQDAATLPSSSSIARHQTHSLPQPDQQQQPSSSQRQPSNAQALQPGAMLSYEQLAGNGNTPGSSEAYVTLVLSGRKYLDMALVLTYSIRMLGCWRDMVVLYAGRDVEELIPTYSLVLEELNIRMVKMLQPAIDTERIQSHQLRTYLSERAEQQLQFSKLYVFLLTQYAKVMYLDVDMLPKEQLAADMEGLWSLPDCAYSRGVKSPLNGGWFVVEPAAEHFQAMREIVYSDNVTVTGSYGQWEGLLEGTDGDDQGRAARGEEPFYASLADQGILYYYLVEVRGCGRRFPNKFNHLTGSCGKPIVADPYSRNGTVYRCGDVGGKWMDYYQRILNALLVANLGDLQPLH